MAARRPARTPDPVDLAQRLYAVTSSGDFSQLDEVLAPDVLDHGVDSAGGPSEDDLRGIEAVRQSLMAFREAFPDAALEVQDAFASGDKVAVRWAVSGTHRAPFHGIPATGRRVQMSGIDVLRVVGGKIAERWGSSDELGLLQQLVDRRGSERRARAAAVPGQPPAERRRGGRRQGDPSLG